VPESWAYNKEVRPVRFDPGMAEALLKQAGWKDANKDGWIEKDGQVFEFTILINQGNDQRKRAAEIIQKRLAEVGIRVKIRVVEWSAFLNEFIDKKKFEAVILGWSLSREPDIYDIWHSSKIKEGEFNFISYKNSEVDALLEQGRRIFDQAARKEIYNKVHKIIYEEQACCFLYVADALPIINARFRGIEVAPAGIGHNFIKWYVPKKEQIYR